MCQLADLLPDAGDCLTGCKIYFVFTVAVDRDQSFSIPAPFFLTIIGPVPPVSACAHALLLLVMDGVVCDDTCAAHMLPCSCRRVLQ